MPKPEFCVFEYVYRDAANYKARGQELLEGTARAGDIETLRAKLECGELFIPGQVGLAPLQQKLWASCGCEPDDELDHLWYEFHELRTATAEDLASLTCSGTLANLVQAFQSVQAWDVGSDHPSAERAATPFPTPTTPAPPH